MEDAEAIETDYQADLGKELRAAAGEEVEEEEGEEEDEEEIDDEIEASKRQKGKSAAVKKGASDDLEEAERMKDIMMTRKNRKLYERIKRAQEGKRERVEVLETRKRAVAQKEEKAVAQAPAALGKRQAAGGKRQK